MASIKTSNTQNKANKNVNYEEKTLFENTKIRQKLHGGIIYFEDKTHYYVATLKDDEYCDSRDNV